MTDMPKAFDPQAVFIQRLVTKSYTPKKGTKPPVAEMVAMRRSFAAQCQSDIDERPFSAIQRLALKAALPEGKVLAPAAFQGCSAPAWS